MIKMPGGPELLELYCKRLCTDDARVCFYKEHVGVEGAQSIADAMKNNISVTGLFFRTNKIFDAGAQIIAKMLQGNKSVIRLALSDNCIGDAGAHSISEMLEGNTTVSRLWLDANHIADSGAQSIANVLESNKTVITFLSLDNNVIGDAGAHSIADMLEVNTRMTGLSLKKNNISDAGKQRIAEAVAANPDLKLEALSGVKLNDYTEAMGIDASFKSKDNAVILAYLRKTAAIRANESATEALQWVFVKSECKEESRPSKKHKAG